MPLIVKFQYPKGHVSKSICANATFRLVSAPPTSTSGSLLGEFLPNLSLAIWTIAANAGEIWLIAETAPTVSPLNSVAVNSKLQYAVVEVHALLGDASMSPGDRKKRLGNVLKEQNRPFLIIASDLLSTIEAKWGTKLVVTKILMGSDLKHCRLCLEIEILNCIMYIHPIDSRECPVIIGGDYITTESGTGLVHTAPGHEHKYPYDWWRTKKPTIFRATEQWFASVEGFREAAMDAISQVTFLSQVVDPLLQKILPLYVIMQNPSSSWAAVLEKRSGLSFPADLYLEGTDQHRGWFQSSLLTSITTKGSSWAAVLEKRSGLSFPADLYLEVDDSSTEHTSSIFTKGHPNISTFYTSLGQEQGLGTPSGWCLSLGETQTTYDPHLGIIKYMWLGAWS
ncbi:hypothetical protein TEA_016759 [Camellia sinensis var. sinensis]|uniref:Aminoacyl-tRNA synthetase class Ia domain-containing protein n=1 Tax=Camellia sinensis var. sinensis TaxID=542762 RepID=A0A4S4ECS7_CAMSN|nr:hypothetical protein TEA_016759 [Camellia sinensis var. sinensis]